VDLGTLSSANIIGWHRKCSRHRWSRSWCWLSESLWWRCICSSWPPVSVRIICIRNNYTPFIQFVMLIVPTNWNERNRGFPEVWHCFHVPECSVTGHDALGKRHDHYTNHCECDNKHLMNGSHFLWQYHTTSVGILLHHPVWFLLPMMIVLTPYD